MRYFLISYKAQNKNLISGILTMECENFPSCSEITEMVNKDLEECMEVIILNIFEFKNEEDYNNFNK